MQETPAGQAGLPLRILWSAFVGAVCVYIVVAYVLRQQTGQALATIDRDFMTPIFAVAAVIITLFIFSGAKVLAKALDYQVYCLVRWALLEAIGLFGLVLALIGASLTVAGSFFGWALLSLFRVQPTPEDQRQYQVFRTGHSSLSG
ncbi:MAG: hypothetical protein AB7G75_26495 [Candidatus Binatia bacterium]